MELGIVLRNKWQEPFFRSELIVIFLQISFALVLLGFAYIFFSQLYNGVLKTVVDGIMENITSGNFDNGADITNSLQIIRSKNFVLFATLLAILTAVFTFLITKMTLRPTKVALDSQKRFISDIAHELRTPLSIIKTNNEVTLMEDKIDPQVRKMIQGNIEELDRISEIINNVLSFNNVLRPERVKFDNVDIGPVVDQVVNKLCHLVEKKHLDITVKKVAPHIVWGNAVALEQIVTNLLKNAINYTSKEGVITVRVGPDYYGNVVVHIEDTGIGMTKKDLLHIFEPFYRAERSRNRGKGSSGLGLTITRELVKMHAGQITIKSLENRGTTAIVTLPFSQHVDEENIDLSGLSEVSVNFLRKRK